MSLKASSPLMNCTSKHHGLVSSEALHLMRLFCIPKFKGKMLSG